MSETADEREESIDELLPERSEHEDEFWYAMGIGAGAVSIATADLVGYQVPRTGLLLAGLVILVGGFIYMVVQ